MDIIPNLRAIQAFVDTRLTDLGDQRFCCIPNEANGGYKRKHHKHVQLFHALFLCIIIIYARSAHEHNHKFSTNLAFLFLFVFLFYTDSKTVVIVAKL